MLRQHQSRLDAQAHPYGNFDSEEMAEMRIL